MKLNKVGRASSPPRGFNRAAYQKRIDDVVGTRDGRPIIKLAWAPEERRWMPHRLTDAGEPINPQGYVFPIFCSGKDANGELTAPNRWVLLERIEPEQFAPTWELGRYSFFKGSMWDWKGPLPTEKYIELRAHCYHDGECCKCIGSACECGVEYAHCWGKYAEPNEQLMSWIRQKNWESQQDSDVQPLADGRYLESPRAQQALRSSMLGEQEKDKASFDEFNRHFVDHWVKQPASVAVGGYKQTESGLIVPNMG
jgi:hypothetical protein